MPTEEEVRAKPKSNLDFRLMSLTYKFRDFLLSPMSILKEVGIEAGFHVLDYGCGPGGYIVPLAKLVGKSGKIYALDIHPLAFQSVQRLASRRRLENVQTIFSDCKTGLLPNSIDLVLLYDILHGLDDANGVLAELHRVLRPKGILSLSDHHMQEGEIISRVTSGGLFKLSAKDKRTYSFSRFERRIAINSILPRMEGNHDNQGTTDGKPGNGSGTRGHAESGEDEPGARCQY